MSDEKYLRSIHKAFLDFKLRAENTGDQILAQTFVDFSPLTDLLLSSNSQIIYGRRDTGKTHALRFIADAIGKKGDTSIYIDLRSIGSNTSIYNDYSKPLALRASYLITDVLECILANLYTLAVDSLDTAVNPDAITVRIDDFQTSISAVKIIGQAETERTDSGSSNSNQKVAANISKTDLSVTMTKEQNKLASSADRLKYAGEEIIHIDFSSTQSSLSGLLEVIGVQKLWLMIDEWSEVPLELQPYLADLFRRILLPTGKLVIKMGIIRLTYHAPTSRT